MRVIAGKYRRITLNTVKGLDTRPTTDRIKETLFNIINDEVYGCSFLDLFAGSGQIGIEALSRHASSVTFIDNNRACVDCIKDNLLKCHIDEGATVINGNALATLKRLDEDYDIVFMDPPYGKDIERDVLEFLSEESIVTDGGLVIVEADLKSEFDYISELNFELVQDKRYKTNRHLILRKI